MGSLWSTTRPEVQVATGRLRGKTEVTPAGTRFHSFLGIPYAKPPLGELRFKAPEPAEPWTGVREAVAEGSICCQQNMVDLNPYKVTLKDILSLLRNFPTLIHRYRADKGQSEDCLYLNVFTPAGTMPLVNADKKNSQQALRPVLFWIHGGAFQMCDGNPDIMAPELFLDKNIVVVTMNYRLGPFGFLALGTADVPGNAGLKDQTMALRWTRDNIRAFGGDPDAITVYGVSAGGASAHFHHVSPLSKGLFRGVIASSGTSAVPWAVVNKSLDCARGLAKELGLEAETPEELAKALRSVSAARIVQAAHRMPKICDGLMDELMFLPVVEPDLPGAFITEHPVDIVREGKHNPVPLIAGMCSAEGLVWIMFATTGDDEEKALANVQAAPLYFLPPDLRQALSPEQREQCHKDILHEYTGGKPFGRDNLVQLIELSGDVMFMRSLTPLARIHAAADRSPIYLYRFNFEGRMSFLKSMIQGKLKGLKVPGASHGDDIWYLADVKLFPQPQLPADSREMLCRRRMLQLWTNFMETGDPTPPGTDKSLLPVEWSACSVDSQPYLEINDTLEFKKGNIFPRQPFWDSLHRKYLGKPIFT